MKFEETCLVADNPADHMVVDQIIPQSGLLQDERFRFGRFLVQLPLKVSSQIAQISQIDGPIQTKIRQVATRQIVNRVKISGLVCLSDDYLVAEMITFAKQHAQTVHTEKKANEAPDIRNLHLINLKFLRLQLLTKKLLITPLHLKNFAEKLY